LHACKEIKELFPAYIKCKGAGWVARLIEPRIKGMVIWSISVAPLMPGSNWRLKEINTSRK
jgi:hypothetical protein